MRSLLCLLALSVVVLYGCNIKTTLHIAKQTRSGFAQFTFFNGTKSRVYKLTAGEKPPADETFMISGKACNEKQTLLETFEKDPESGGKRLLVSGAHLDGNGSMTYYINDFLFPILVSRQSVLCAFGDCGRG